MNSFQAGAGRRGESSRHHAGRAGMVLGGILSWALVPGAPAATGEGQATNPAPSPPPDTRPEAEAGAPAGGGHLKKLSLEALMDVEVTSVSRQESTVAQSPAAITVITPDMIRRSGATTFPELFRMVPGMDVARLDNNKWNVSARGFNGDRFQGKLLVQIDGRTLYSPITSGVYWDTVDYPLEDVDRVEVIRGPGASVWGANAVNGVINIITKSAKDTQGGFITVGGGTAEEAFGELRYGGKIGDSAYYRVYGKGFTRDDTFTSKSAINPNGEAHDDWSVGSGGFRLDWLPNAPDTATLEGGYFHTIAGRKDFRPQPTSGTGLVPFQFTNAEDEVSDGENVLARWNHQVDKDSSWALQAYWDRVARTSTNGILDVQWQTVDLDFQHQFPIGTRQKFIYGLGYRFVDVFFANSSRDDGFVLARFRNGNNIYSGFLQDQISLIEDKLAVTLGSKFEHNDYTGFEYQPTARMLWTPTKRQSAWMAVSRAVRTPNATEVDPAFHLTQNPAGTTFPRQVGNPAYGSEDLIAYELGYRVQATDNVSVDTALFYNVYDNLRVFVPQPPATTTGAPVGTKLLLVPPENAMDGKTYGVEIGANWKLADWWRLYGAYTFLEMQLHPNPQLRKSAATRGAAVAAAAQAGESSEHQLYLRSSWDLPHNLEFDLTGRFVDSLSGFNTGNVPGFPDRISQYIALDARLSWRPTENWELTIVGQNLLDNHHPEAGPNPRVANPLVEMPRGVYAAIAYRW